MHSITQLFDTHGPFLRRRDLLRLGLNDRLIGHALRAHAIFRVRHGWYARPGTTDAAVEAIRVGGKLTGRTALETYGVPVPRSSVVELAVPRNACRLRRPRDKAARLTRRDGTSIRWVDTPRNSGATAQWRVSVDDALLDVLRSESRDVAVACCDMVMRRLGWSWARLDAVFARAPKRVQPWRQLVVDNSDAFGETYVRLWCGDEGIEFVPQPRVRGAGRFDGKISPRTYVEIDGMGHDDADDDDPNDSQFQKDHRRDLTVAIDGGHTLRFTYRQILRQWPSCLAAMRRMIADDLLFEQLLSRHPVPRRRSRRSG
jgi:hypothetical protein